jgi:hypothetical protein
MSEKNEMRRIKVPDGMLEAAWACWTGEHGIVG